MDNSTEELTPILVPFEKNRPDVLTGPGSEYHNKMHGTDTQSASSVLPDSSSDNTPTDQTQTKKDTPKRQGPTKNDVLGGTAMGMNALGSLTTAANTAGEATRKLLQGILNPGLMGQGAASGVLGAADTIVTPDKARQTAQHNMREAMDVAAQGKQLDTEKAENEKITALTDNMTNQLNAEMNRLFTQHGIPGEDALTVGRDANGNRLDPKKMSDFNREFTASLGAMVAHWREAGIDPKLIEKVTERYSDLLHNSLGRIEYGLDESKMQYDQQRAQNAMLDAQNDAVTTRTAWNAAISHKNSVEQAANTISPNLMGALDKIIPDDQRFTDGTTDYSTAYTRFWMDANHNHPNDVDANGKSLFDPTTIQLDLTAFDEGTLKKLEALDPQAYTAIMALKTQESYPHAGRVADAKTAGTAAHIEEVAPTMSYGFDQNFLKNTKIDQATADNLQQTCLKEAWNAYGADLASQFTPDEINAFINNKGLMSLEPSDAKIVDALLSKHREHLGKGGLAQLQAAQKKLGSKKRLTADELHILQLDDTMNAMAAKSKVFADMNRAMEGGSFSFGDTAGDPTKFGAKGKSFVEDVMGRERASAMDKYRESLRLINEEMIRHQSQLARYSADPSKRLPKGLRDYLYEAMRTEQTDSNLADAKNGKYLGGAFGSEASINTRYNKALVPANEARKLLYLSGLGDLEMDNGDISANNFTQSENVLLTVGQAIADSIEDAAAGNTLPGSVIATTTLPKLGVSVDFMKKYGFGTLTRDMLDDPKVMNEIATNLSTLENELNRIASSPDANSHAKTLKEGRGYLAAFRTNMAASLSGRMVDKINEELDAMQAGGASPIQWASNPGTNLPKTLQTLVDRWYTRRTSGENDPSYTKNTALKEVRYILSRPMEFARIGFQLSGDRNSNIFGDSANYRANVIGDRNQDYMGRNVVNKNGGLVRMNSSTKNRSKDKLYVMFANVLYTS